MFLSVPEHIARLQYGKNIEVPPWECKDLYYFFYINM